MISSADSSRKLPLEKGPFGKTTNRRSMSRSKASTPATKEDLVRLENMQTTDDIFARLKSTMEEKQSTRDIQRQPSQLVSQTRPTLDVAPSASSGVAAPQNHSFKEPTEVLLYGFGSDYQYAAIDFFENASKGRIYEDYDRLPPNPHYNTAMSTNRIHTPRTLPQAAMRKINTYQGGEHWIKITFDSPEAAEMACHYSPHIIHGYNVHAELFRGSGPQADVAISASSANMSGASTLIQRKPTRAQSQDWNTMPSRLRGAPLSPQLRRQDSRQTESAELDVLPSTAATTGTDDLAGISSDGPDASQPNRDHPAAPKSLRIPTATRAVLLPASSALLPVPPWTARTFGHLPLIGSLFGGDGSHNDMIGGAVPRNASGNFDWEKASLWWRVCWLLDGWFGTDTCGMKGDD